MAERGDRGHEADHRVGFKQPLTIRGRLLLLLAVIFIPLLFVQALIYYDRFQARQMYEMEANLEMARAVSENFREFVSGILYQEHTIGVAFTAAPPLPPDFLKTMLARMAAEFPAVRDFNWIDRTGVVIASSNPGIPGIDISGQEYFQAISRGRPFRVSDLFLSQATGEPIFTISRRVESDTGEFRGAVVAAILPEKLEEVLRIQRLREGYTGVIDGNGRVVVLHPGREWTWESRYVLDTLPSIRRVLAGKEVTTELYGRRNEEQLMVALTPVRPYGWVAGASRPRRIAMQTVYASLVRHAGLFFLTMLAALAAALWGARGIIAPITRLRDHAREMGHGKLTATARVDSPRELKDLAEAFNAMAGEILLREGQLLRRAAEAEEGKRTLEAAQEARKRLMTIIEETPDLVAIISRDHHHILFLNQNGRDLLGFEPSADLTHVDFCRAYPPWARQIVHQEGIPAAIRNGAWRGETAIARQDGREIPVSHVLIAHRSSAGEITYLSTILRDISELKAAAGELEKARRELETRVAERTQDLADANRSLVRQGEVLQGIIDNIPVMLIFYDETGTLKLLNRQAEAALGVSFETARQTDLLSHVDADPAYRQEVWAYMTSSAPGWRDFRLQLRDGRVLDSSWANVRLSDGSHIGIGIDISERLKAEAEKEMYTRRLEWSNRELQDFAFVASHDLQEPLRKIQSFAHLLVSRYQEVLDEAGRDYLLRMQNASGRMQALIRDLLDYSRVTTRGRPFERVDLNQVIQEVLTDLETRIQETGARIHVGPMASIQADAGQLRQLFLNLIGNALKFNTGQPEIRMEGEEATETQPAGTGRSSGAYRIRVVDNGIGFDPRYLDRIFAPFQRLHGRSEYEGTGMGLAICRKIVERHGGGITAHSRPEEGATFIVTLPFEPPEPLSF